MYNVVDFDRIDGNPNEAVQDGVLTLAERSDIQVIEYTIVANPPEATFTLTQSNGMPVNDERLRVTNQALMIVDVSRDDAGMYSLMYSHPATDTVTFFEFTLV